MTPSAQLETDAGRFDVYEQVTSVGDRIRSGEKCGFGNSDERRLVTVCIAAICDGGKSIVMVADRLATLSYLGITVEQTNKIRVLNESHAIMIAGNARRGQTILRDMPTSLSMLEGVQACVSAYTRSRDKELDDTYLVALGYDRDKFESFGQAQLPKDMHGMIHVAMSKFDFDLDMLHAGFCDGKARLCRVSNPGIQRWVDDKDYDVVGSQSIVQLHMELGGYNADLNVAEALFMAYSAKRRAEANYSVGKITDVRILTVNGESKIQTDRLLPVLEAEFSRTNPVISPDTKAIEDALK